VLRRLIDESVDHRRRRLDDERTGLSFRERLAARPAKRTDYAASQFASVGDAKVWYVLISVVPVNKEGNRLAVCVTRQMLYALRDNRMFHNYGLSNS
jgi:hypothetical protein